jgi:hypothetical protein
MKLCALISVAAMIVSPMIAQNASRAWMADGPNAEYRDELQTFGQFVGAWTFEGSEYHENGSHSTDKGEIHCEWVLEGRAVQDVFMETSRSDNDPLLRGTTIRFFDPKINAWRVTWINPGAGVVRTFIGRKNGKEIVMEGTMGDGTPLRWIFSDIKVDSFHWRGEKRKGSRWRIYEELNAHRK